MRSRLAFACCIAIDFDVYLIDEATSVGDPKFKKKAKAALLEKSKEASVIMVSHDMNEIRQFCDSVVILDEGKLSFYADIEQGIKIYSNM